MQFVGKLLATERHRRGTPKGSQAPTSFWKAVLGPRRFRDRTTPDALSRRTWLRPTHPAIGVPPAHHASPSKISDITQAAPVLTHFERGYLA
jgi:hypothetical protein